MRTVKAKAMKGVMVLKPDDELDPLLDEPQKQKGKTDNFDFFCWGIFVGFIVAFVSMGVFS